MLRTILTKTLYEKRLYMLFWALGIATICLITLSFYPSFSQDGGIGDALKNLPKSVQTLVGDISTIKTVPGYIGQQLFSLRMPLLSIIFALILFTGLLVGDEADGTLQTLLVQPVNRTRVLLEKLLAGMAAVAIIGIGMFVGIRLALLLIHADFSNLRLLQSIAGCWLITLVFGVFTLMIGAITGKKGITSGLAAGVTFLCYFITSLAPSVSQLRGIEKLSPFHYYNNPIIAQHGLKGSHVMVLTSAIVVMLIIAIAAFNKRDVYQR